LHLGRLDLSIICPSTRGDPSRGPGLDHVPDSARPERATASLISSSGRLLDAGSSSLSRPVMPHQSGDILRKTNSSHLADENPARTVGERGGEGDHIAVWRHPRHRRRTIRCDKRPLGLRFMRNSRRTRLSWFIFPWPAASSQLTDKPVSSGRSRRRRNAAALGLPPSSTNLGLM